MIIVAVVVTVGVAVGWLLGGRVRNLADVQLRAWPLLVLALSAQAIVAAGAAGGDRVVARVLLAAAHGAVLGFLWANRRLPGVVLLAAGAAANAVVVVANGAMPVSRRALQAVGADALEVRGARHVLAESIDGGARLPWLGDVLPVPWVGVALSPGDVLLALGAVVLLPAVMCRPQAAGSDPARRRLRR